MAQFLPSRLYLWLRSAPSSSKSASVFNYAFQKNSQHTFYFESEKFSVSKKIIHNRANVVINGQNVAKVQSSELSGNSEGAGKDESTKKSKSQKKREALRAVKWGMQLAELSPPQLKRIIRVAGLEDEVIDAIMLAKKLGFDGREAKRRQFNYIGGLLRKVQPELMEAVIQATKDGDMDRFQALPSKVSEPIREDLESDGEESEEEEMDEEVLLQYAEVAKRWSEGLISGDASITREVYSIYNIDFDRQELRKLVREVHARQDSEMIEETSSRTEASEALDQARKSLDNFLTELAKQSSINAY